MTPRTKIARALWRALSRDGVPTPPQDPDTEGGRAVMMVIAREFFPDCPDGWPLESTREENAEWERRQQEEWVSRLDEAGNRSTEPEPVHWTSDIRRKYEGRWNGRGYNAAPSPPRLTGRGRVRK